MSEILEIKPRETRLKWEQRRVDEYFMLLPRIELAKEGQEGDLWMLWNQLE